MNNLRANQIFQRGDKSARGKIEFKNLFSLQWEWLRWMSIRKEIIELGESSMEWDRCSLEVDEVTSLAKRSNTFRSYIKLKKQCVEKAGETEYF